MTSILRILRIVRVGAALALLVGLSGWALGRARFGASDEAALAKVQLELEQRIDAGAATLGAMSEQITRQEAAIRRMPRDQAAIRRLFDIVGAALGDAEGGRTGITIYDSDSTPLAWGGRVLDLPRERLDGPAALLVASGGFGPSLIRVEPVPAFPAPRIATVVVEQALGPLQSASDPNNTFLLATSLVAVRVRARVGDVPASDRPFTFVISAPGGGALFEVEVLPADLAAARAGWRSGTWAAVMIVLAVTLLLCAGPLVDLRRRTHKSTVFLLTTATLVVIVTGARSVLFFALEPFAAAGPTPLDLLLTTLTMAAVVWLVMDLVEHRRFARPRPPVCSRTAGAMLMVGLGYLVAGVASAALFWGYEDLLRRVVADTDLNLLHFSLHPISGARFAVEFALVLLHASVVWGAAVVIRVPAMLCRTPRTRFWRLLAAGGWFAGSLLTTVLARTATVPVPLGPLWVALLVSGGAALALARGNGRIRRFSQTARLLVFFLALLAPSMALYPSMLAHATEAKERLVAMEFGPQAISQREDLQRRLQRAVDQIDAIPSLYSFVFGGNAAAPTTDRAFLVWSRTDLATYRLTSAVELYDVEGRLVSRFALVPEYANAPYRATGCN
ncbi:MAG TPA: hypothetical protein VGH34_16800, partial [Vicinamibacterales bacterium]